MNIIHGIKKRILLLISILIVIQSYGQPDSVWKGFIVEPDIYVFFPGIPQVKNIGEIKSYEFSNDEIILKVTSEKSPIIYFGRTIKEVDSEYYGSLTAKIISPRQKLLEEDNYKFENHNVRRYVYADTIDKKPCVVTLEILNVTGYEDAMYKFYLIDFKNRIKFPDKYLPFFSDWNLYYKIENQIDQEKGNENEFLKKKGFTIANHQTNYKPFIITVSVIALITWIVILKFKKKNSK
jgi:hypothetical protein